MQFHTKIVGAVIRPATKEDITQILAFVRELAAYEKLSDQVVATEELFEEWMFRRGVVEALLCELGGEPAGMALYFHNFSTFLGRGGLYLEDLFVRPAFRGRGIGKELFRALAGIALERGCGRLEWSCLDWNTPSIGFYRSLGAESLDDWTTYRLAGENLAVLAK